METKPMVLALAELTVTCEIRTGDTTAPCLACLGTGTVPLVPGLRVPCGWWYCGDGCDWCDNRTWNPVSAQAAMIVLVKHLRGQLVYRLGGWVYQPGAYDLVEYPQKREPEDAVIAAAHAALIPSPEPVTGGE